MFIPANSQTEKIKIGEVSGISIHAGNNNRIVQILLQNQIFKADSQPEGQIEIIITNREKNSHALVGSGKFGISH